MMIWKCIPIPPPEFLSAGLYHSRGAAKVKERSQKVELKTKPGLCGQKMCLNTQKLFDKDNWTGEVLSQF